MSLRLKPDRRTGLLASVSALAMVVSALVVAQSNSVSQADDGVGDVGTVVPARLLDTRPNGDTIDDQFQGAGKVQADTFTKVKIAGRGNVPDDAVGVEVNITAIQNEGRGFATLYPCTPDTTHRLHPQLHTRHQHRQRHHRRPQHHRRSLPLHLHHRPLRPRRRRLHPRRIRRRHRRSGSPVGHPTRW